MNAVHDPTFDTSMSDTKIKTSNSMKPGSKGLGLAWSVGVRSIDSLMIGKAAR